jgi:hypothetical protein
MFCSVEDHMSGYFCKRHKKFEEKNAFKSKDCYWVTALAQSQRKEQTQLYTYW